MSYSNNFFLYSVYFMCRECNLHFYLVIKKSVLRPNMWYNGGTMSNIVNFDVMAQSFGSSENMMFNPIYICMNGDESICSFWWRISWYKFLLNVVSSIPDKSNVCSINTCIWSIFQWMTFSKRDKRRVRVNVHKCTERIYCIRRVWILLIRLAFRWVATNSCVSHTHRTFFYNPLITDQNWKKLKRNQSTELSVKVRAFKHLNDERAVCLFLNW